MLPEFFFEEKEVLEAVKYFPCVSIILPFEPKMSVKRELEYQLQRAIDRAEADLAAAYPAEKYKPVVTRLKKLVKTLDYSTYKQSIALFVSPLMEKVHYLDIPVEEKIVIDESFEIRDLVYSKKDIHKYLILVLGNRQSQIFLGNTRHFLRIVSNRPEQMPAGQNDPPERVANFSDPSARKEVLLDKFLHHIDNGLGIVLNAYSLPLFVMGTVRTVGHFKKISHFAGRIVSCVHGNFEGASEQDIHDTIAPHIADWKKVKQEDLLHRIDAAMGAKKLTTGVANVWKEAHSKKGRLLIVEKSYLCPAGYGADESTIVPLKEVHPDTIYLKDAVDDIIEMVLENGGDVEFVAEDALKDYQRIALIQYY